MKQLCVRLLGNQVGTLIQNDIGTLDFIYIDEAKRNLSISMPLQQKLFSNRQCRPYFEGLLPESDVVRNLLGKRYGISAHNIFSLLEAVGHDCAGAVSFHQMDEEIVSTDSYILDGREIDIEELKKIIIDLPKRPLFTDIDGLRLSLAGVQDKAALCYEDGKFIIPHNLCPTTHIIKTAIPDIKDSIFNEYACLKIAKAIGLSACQVEIVNLDEIEFLLIERYDRTRIDGKIMRLHQEDFCQALAILPGNKYENEAGPSATMCFKLVDNSFSPAKDKITFLKYFIYNTLIGNKDAHGKNYSFLYDHNYHPNISPLYDVLCTDIYPTLAKKMAMKIGGKYILNDVYDRHWKSFTEDLNISYSQLKKLISTMADQIKLHLNSPTFEIQTKNREMWENLRNHITKNIDTTIKRI